VAGLWRLSVVSVRGVGGLKGVLLSAVRQWGTEEVAAWLELICLTEYKEIFIGHDLRGAELLHLERRDLKVLHTHTHTCRLSQISLLPPKVCNCLLPCTHLKGNSGIRNSHYRPCLHQSNAFRFVGGSDRAVMESRELNVVQLRI
jgi:hypothetical protein